VPPGQALAHADALGKVLDHLKETLATGVTVGCVIAVIRYLPR
jgi:hypothetical protein